MKMPLLLLMIDMAVFVCLFVLFVSSASSSSSTSSFLDSSSPSSSSPFDLKNSTASSASSSLASTSPLPYFQVIIPFNNSSSGNETHGISSSSSSTPWSSTPSTTTASGTTNTELPVASSDEDESSSGAGRLEWGEVRAVTIAGQGPSSYVTEVHWTIPLVADILKASIPLVLSPKFYVSVPGHRIQLMLVPNSTYSDNTSYLGIFFRLVTGQFDADIIWPYQYKTTAGVLSTDDDMTSSFNWTVIPNRDPCRLRSAFLRPSTDDDSDPRPDGCGSRRVIDLRQLNSSFIRDDGSLVVVTRVMVNDTGNPFDSAKVSVKFNDIMSEYIWTIKNFRSIQTESYRTSSVAVLSSDPFYTHPSGYLIQLFLTLLPVKNAFAISMAFLQGDFDRSLDWPFPYPFEVALIDQSPSYWKRDYSVNLDSSSADCGSSPFMQPSTSGSNSIEFCFLTVQSMELLSLTHYNFIRDGNLNIRFMSKVLPMSRRPMAAISVKDRHLVAEYSWLIPDIENKLERFDYSGRKVKTFTSEKFYSSSQGYLMQMMLQLNHTDRANGSMGLEMTILEGDFDSILKWPFANKFELLIINQRPDSGSPSPSPQHHPSGDDDLSDIIIGIDPLSSSCDNRSFTKPIERNPPCGHRNVISFARVQRSTSGFVRLGSLLVKARIYLTPII